MFSQLCNARLWPRPRKKGSQLELLKVQRNLKKEEYMVNLKDKPEELNQSLKIQIQEYLSSEKELNLNNRNGFCQETNNPAYGLMPDLQPKTNMHHIMSKHNLKEVTEESSRTERSSGFTSANNVSSMCRSKDYVHEANIAEKQKGDKGEVINVPNKCNFTSIRSQQPILNRTPRSQSNGRDNRIRKRCQKRRVPETHDSRQNKALEEVVNMFDRHFSKALSLQQKNSSSEDFDSKSIFFTPLHQSTLKHRTVPGSKQIENTSVANKNKAMSADTLPTSRYPTDVEKLLQTATQENPANVSMVVMQCSRLKSHLRNEPPFHESSLAMGTLVNALFLKEDWLCVQTPHGQKGFIHQSCCISMGSLHKNKPTSRDCKVKQETLPVVKKTKDSKHSSQVVNKNTKNVLYSVLADVNPVGFHRDHKVEHKGAATWDKSVLVVIFDYNSENANTLTVKKGDLVRVTEITGSSDDKDWLWVQLSTGRSGYIPKAVTKPVAVFQ